MTRAGDVISYVTMCQLEGTNLQRGMNYMLGKTYSVILMSVRVGAPYADQIEDAGRILIYEGHDVPKTRLSSKPKNIDQPMKNPGGGLTQNGLFYEAAIRHKTEHKMPEKVKVYEKIKAGIWVYNGLFDLKDAWLASAGQRKVFKFRLEITDDNSDVPSEPIDLDHTRLIPTKVKLQVWQRDKGVCVRCSSKDNLHFDHILPYSKGGTSLVTANIQLLCARHNLSKRDNIE